MMNVCLNNIINKLLFRNLISFKSKRFIILFALKKDNIFNIQLSKKSTIFFI